MLVGGADASGDKRREGQRNYLAFLIGTEEIINTIYNKIGLDEIHMDDLTKKERNHIYENLDFSSKDISVWCFHVRRQHVEEYILKHNRLRNYRKPKVNIHKNFDHHLLNSIKDEFESFVYSRKQDFQMLLFKQMGM